MESITRRSLVTNRLIVVGFNILAVAVYLFFLDISSRLLSRVLLAMLGFCFLSLITLKSTMPITSYIHNIHVSLLSVLVLFCVMEAASRLYPDLVPLQIRNYLSRVNLEKIQSATVEYLDTSPFVKFKGNTVLRSQGYRGSDEQFVYEWKTDKWGFKNMPEVAERSHVTIVALGNSFTEGMGVATEKTWPSVLTMHGYPTYNLGVQGYAPIQLEGSFRKYGIKLAPKYVVIGYCAGTFKREEAFLDLEGAISKRKFTGGIQSSIEAELMGREIRSQTKYLPSAIYLLGRNTILNIIHRRYRYSIDVKSPLFERYVGEIASVGSELELREIAEIESPSKAWARTMKAFCNIKAMADTIGAKTILIYFPHRGETYYEKATGNMLPESCFGRIEGEKLKEFSSRHDVIFLNTSERIRRYVNAMENNSPVSKYPYLEIDGHLSSSGHELVSQEILGYVENQQL